MNDNHNHENEPKAAKARKYRSYYKPWWDVFFEVLGQGASIQDAAEAAGVRRQHVYRVKDGSEEFSRRYDEALEDSIKAIETVAIGLAVNGRKRKKFNAKGAPIIDPDTGKQYVEIEHDTGLIRYMLERRMNKVYGPHQTVDVNLNARIGVVEDDDWYGNAARLQTTEAPEQPSSDPAE